MNKQIKVFLTSLLAVVSIFSFAALALADYDATKAQGPGVASSSGETNQQNNSEQNQGQDIMNQEQNKEQEKEQNQAGFICADHCGDGICAEMVCQAEGCPCAENINNCPEDCGESDSGNG
jgi:hypothetical protein